MDCTGCVQLEIKTRVGFPVIVDAIVSSSLVKDCIISWHDLQKLGIISESFPDVVCTAGEEDQTRQLKESILSKYPDVISDVLPKRPMKGPEMEITFEDNQEIIPKRINTTRQ